MTREEIKWQELFIHFRAVQAKHEKSRRMTNGTAGPLLDGYQEKRAAMRRKSTSQSMGGSMGMGMGAGSASMSSSVGSMPPRALSPLNPRSGAQRQQASLGMAGGMAGMGGQANGLLLTALGGGPTAAGGQPRSMSPTLIGPQKGRPIPKPSGLSLSRK
jgi:hypothetical protein